MFPEKIQNYAAITAGAAALVGGVALLSPNEVVQGHPEPVPCEKQHLMERDLVVGNSIKFTMLFKPCSNEAYFHTTIINPNSSASPGDPMPNVVGHP